MFSKNKYDRFDSKRDTQDYKVRGKNVPHGQKKKFYTKNQYKKFFYHDINQKKGKLAQKLNAKFNKNATYNLNKNNRHLYYANLLQKTSGFPLEEQVIFERLWKCALGQTFGNRLPAKVEKKNCCCHCQCGDLDTVANRNENNKVAMVRSLMDERVSKKTMKSVVR